MITFARGEDSVEFRDPVVDYGPEEPPRQRVWMSGGGVMRVAILGDPDVVFKMDFKEVPNAMWESMREFIQDVIEYSAQTFTYTDTFGAEHTGMRYVSGIETWRQRRGQRWHGSLVIRKDLGNG